MRWLLYWLIAAVAFAAAAPARADLTPVVGAGTSVVVVTESAFG